MQTNKQRRTEATTSVVSKSEKANEVETVDRFTFLPTEIIHTILTFLPMKVACRACCTTKKLSHLLTSVPNLHFGHKGNECTLDENRRTPVEIVQRFLDQRDVPIRSFRLQLDLNKCTFDFDHWIVLLKQNGIEDLELDIHGTYELPSHLYNCETIRSLKLWPPTCLRGFGLVESMFLGEIILSDNIISCLLSTCVVLRTLALEKCKGFKKIEILNPNSRLECLKLEFCPTAITVNAPNLHTLYYLCDSLNLCLKGALYGMNLVYYRRESSDYPICVYPQEGRNLKKNVLNNLAHLQSNFSNWMVE